MIKDGIKQARQNKQELRFILWLWLSGLEQVRYLTELGRGSTDLLKDSLGPEIFNEIQENIHGIEDWFDLAAEDLIFTINDPMLLGELFPQTKAKPDLKIVINNVGEKNE